MIEIDRLLKELAPQVLRPAGPRRRHPDLAALVLPPRTHPAVPAGISATLATALVGPYQLQAAIAAVHDEAATPQDTDWPQILVLYRLLEQIAPGPMVTLNRIVEQAMVLGRRSGLKGPTSSLIPVLPGNHRVHAVRAHLQELAGDFMGASAEYCTAARLTRSVPEQRYLGLARYPAQLTHARITEQGSLPRSGNVHIHHCRTMSRLHVVLGQANQGHRAAGDGTAG